MQVPKYILLWITLVSILIYGYTEAGEYRVGIMPHSTHLVGGDFNEDHQGFLIERKLSKKKWLGYMRYNNSYYHTSNTIYWQTELWSKRGVSVGYQYGAVTGYDELEIFPYANITIQFGMIREVILPMVIGHQLIVEF